MFRRAALFIIGFGPGIGLGIARAFGRSGYSLGLISRRTTAHRDLAHGLVQAGSTARLFQADAARPESLKRALGEARAMFGGEPEVLVYNAAAAAQGPASALSPEGLAANLRVDVVGALTAAQEVLPGMRRRGSGSVLFTGGGLALNPAVAMSSLSIGKAALRNLALVLHKEAAGSGVKVGLVSVMSPVAPDRPLTADRVGATFLEMHRRPSPDFPAEIQLS
ncbi:MAG: SDR family oxidoreductase [Acidobacteriota bacterium]